MSESELFEVPADLAGKTLAAALKRMLPGRSWRQVESLVAARRVLVGRSVCIDPARRLAAGELVCLSERPLRPKVETTDVPLAYIDAHVLVAQKPAGVATVRHPAERAWREERRLKDPALTEIIERQLSRQPTATGRANRLRVVQRLDRDTSGLVVFARTADAERGLVEQFRKRRVHRRYLAIVRGRIGETRIESRLVRDRGDGRRGSTTLAGAGKIAITHVRPLEDLPGCQLVQCRLETGRTHQIRIHLAEAGSAVLGDRVYGSPVQGPPPPDAFGSPRLALHAAELGFVHPIDGRALNFSMALPADLARFLERLRRRESP